jgi:hypothetical protein
VAMSDWFSKNVKIRPEIALRFNSALTAGSYLDSTTPGSAIDQIAGMQMSESDWGGTAKFKVGGTLY